MNSALSRARLPVEARRACATIRHTQPGIDRLHLYLDTPAPDLPVEDIRALCAGGAKFVLGPMPFGSRWAGQLRLWQPSRAAIELVAASVAGRYAVHMSDVEIACDLVTRHTADAHSVAKYFLGHLLLPNQREGIRPGDGTLWYWRSAQSRVRGQNLVLYWDRPSKQYGPHRGRPCAHLELRLSGAEALARYGIFDLSNLAGLDHAKLWARAVKLVHLQLSDVGALLGESASGTALRNRARKYLRSHRDWATDVVVLQDALVSDPWLNQVFRQVNVATVLFGRASFELPL